MDTPISRKIDDNELSVYLDTKGPLPLQEVLTFYRSIEAHLRKPHLLGPAFALELIEYKAGSSEGRFLGFWRPGKRKGQLAKQLELEERQAISAERQADAAEREADAAEDQARSAKSTKTGTWVLVGAAVVTAAAAVIATAIEYGEIETPTDIKSGKPRAECVIVGSAKEQVRVIPPAEYIVKHHKRQMKEAARVSGQSMAALRKERQQEWQGLRDAARHVQRLSIVGRPIHHDSCVVTRLGNAIPIVDGDLRELQAGQDYYLYLVPTEQDGKLLWRLKEARALDEF